MQDKALEKCKGEILQKLGKSPDEKWMGRELKILADEIFQKSKIKLSINTLKRIFGIIEYNSNPTLLTKDALAQYLDYKNWEDFLQRECNTSLVQYEKGLQNYTSKNKTTKKIFHILFLVLSISTILIYFIIKHPKYDTFETSSSTIDSSQITLKINPKEGNVPLDLYIEYSKDSSIQDTLKLVVENQDEFPVFRTSDKLLFTYLIPGKYSVSFTHNNDTIKKAIVNATTNDWVGMIYRIPNTVYTYSLYEKNDLLSFPDSLIKILDQEGERYYIAFSNFKEFHIAGDDFRLKTRYRNTGGNFISQTGNMYINLFCENGMIKTSFINEGMQRYLKLIFSEKIINSVSQDLSSFIKQNLEWIEATIHVNDSKISIFREDSLIFTTSFDHKLGKVYGIEYFFVGNGEIDYLYLWNENDSLIIENDF